MCQEVSSGLALAAPFSGVMDAGVADATFGGKPFERT